MIARKFELPSLKNSEPVLHQNEIKSFQILGKVLSQCEGFFWFFLVTVSIAMKANLIMTSLQINTTTARNFTFNDFSYKMPFVKL